MTLGNQNQVSTTPTEKTNDQIRSAIDLLLSSDSVEVKEPLIKLTECSPEVDVVINKLGGICTRCNTMFKSRVSLLNHLEKCDPNFVLSEDDNLNNNISEDNIDEDNNFDDDQPIIKLHIKQPSPKLVIVSQ